MSTKTFELTIDERNTLLDVLWHCMETNFNCNTRSDGAWTDVEHKAEQEEMQALYDKLKPEKVEKCGWIMKERLPGEVWMNVPHGEEDKFQFITWEEQE